MGLVFSIIFGIDFSTGILKKYKKYKYKLEIFETTDMDHTK